MPKERETIIAAMLATVFSSIVIGLCTLVTLQAQSSMPADTPLSALTTVNHSADSALDLRLVYYGYPKIGVPRSGAAIIGEGGLSDIHDITFSLIGGELSPDGRFIAYLRCSSTNRGIYLAEADGSNAQVIKDLNGSSCVDIRWSPDSAKLSYASQQDRSLHIFDIASKSDTLIPNTQGADLHWWSPTGDEIVYEKMRRNDANRPIGRLLYITDLSGNTRQLTFAEDFVPCARGHNIVDTWSPAWSPKGDAIAFTQGECLFLISPTGKNLRQLPVKLAYNPRWSPDGRWIIFNGEGGLCRIGDGAVLSRISADGNTIVEIGKVPYCGGTFSIAPRK